MGVESLSIRIGLHELNVRLDHLLDQLLKETSLELRFKSSKDREAKREVKSYLECHFGFPSEILFCFCRRAQKEVLEMGFHEN